MKPPFLPDRSLFTYRNQMSRQLTFYGKKHLRRWLTESPEGKAVLAKVQHPRQQPVHVLAIVFSDRIELFAGKRSVWVKVEQALHCSTPEAEVLAEELIELQLPLFWRQLFFPGNRVATLTPRKLLPSQYRDQQAYWESVKAVMSIGNETTNKR